MSYDAEMARRGRPPKDRVMDVMFSFKLYREVLEALRKGAEADGESLAAWLTDLGLKRCKRLGIVPHEPSG